jgi:ketosteroid isomerase-like protein
MEGTSSKAELMIMGLGAYQQGDDETLRRLMHPDIETYSEPGMINSGTFRGFDGFKSWSAQWEEAWEEIRYEPVEFIDVDEALLVARVRVVGKGAGSGLEVDREFGYLYEIREGRATRFHLYESAEKAREVANRLAAERETE